jgi:YfiH family protein
LNSPSPEDSQSQRTQDCQIYRVPQWNQYPWLIHGFSTRLGGFSQFRFSQFPGPPATPGQLNLGFTAIDDPDSVSRNRAKFLSELQPELAKLREHCGLITLKQMHSSLVRRVDRAQIAERASLWGDGLLTSDPGTILSIQTADCLPILIADTKNHAVAAFHAGWRGTLKRIVQRGVESMQLEFGSHPKDLTAAIGPGIGQCCFEVGPEVRDRFAGQFSYAHELFTPQAKPRLDLVAANRRQLLAAGLDLESIFSIDLCTSCRTDLFFSYRAEHGKTGRMMSAIGILPD